MKTPINLTVIPKAGFKITNGYGAFASPKAKEVKAKRAWRIQARRILLGWSGVARVIAHFDDGSEDEMTWDQATSHSARSPMGQTLKEINNRKAA